MPTFTKHLNLRKPEENDFYNQETEQCENWDKLDNWSEEIDNKTIGATSEAPGIVKYGTDVSTALEGHRMAQILGVEDFGGDVQITGIKKAGYSYWCTANKEMYKCKVENSLNYIDDAYFDAFSNAALLGKLQNLSIRTTKDLATTTDLRIGVRIIHPTFNRNSIQDKIFKISCPSKYVSMEFMVAPGFMRGFIIHGAANRILTVSLEVDGYILYGDATDLSSITLVELAISSVGV